MSPLDWEGTGSPSVGARCPAVTTTEYNANGVVLQKCHLFHENFEYLRQFLRPGQLMVNQKKIKSLAQSLPSGNLTELKSFLGMCNVYRRFIKEYAHIARPLRNLTSTTLPHVLPTLDTAQLAAFAYLSERLTSTPILALPRRESLLISETDACTFHLGCNLLQQKPDKSSLPVSYYNRGLIPAEKTYSTTARECLVVVWARFLLLPYLEEQ